MNKGSLFWGHHPIQAVEAKMFFQNIAPLKKSATQFHYELTGVGGYYTPPPPGPFLLAKGPCPWGLNQVENQKVSVFCRSTISFSPGMNANSISKFQKTKNQLEINYETKIVYLLKFRDILFNVYNLYDFIKLYRLLCKKKLTYTYEKLYKCIFSFIVYKGRPGWRS